MERKVTVHLQGFFDPLEGRLSGDFKEESLRQWQGSTSTATIRADGTNMVVNHEEQYGYTIGFDDPLTGRKLAEQFRDGRRAEVSVSRDGNELRIRY